MIASVVVGLFLLIALIQYLQMNVWSHPSERVTYYNVVEVDVEDSSKAIQSKAKQAWDLVKDEVESVSKMAVKPANKHATVLRTLEEEVPADN